MRLNIEWLAPWMAAFGENWIATRRYIFYPRFERKGMIRGGWSIGCTLLGFRINLTTDALWSGIGLSINIWEGRKNGV